MTKRTIVSCAVALLALSACSSKKAASSFDANGTPTASASVAGPNPATGTKPVVEVPKGPAPTQLVIKDLIVGSGAEAKNGTSVKVQYVGVHFADGKQFDASWDGAGPFDLSLPGGVIKGWNQGIPGMKVGGRRMLIIPPDLGYGAQGYPPVIQPNETLVFVIDLLSVT